MLAPLRTSVRHRLILGLSGVAVFTIAATLIAAWTFMSHREHLNRIVELEVPTLLIAAEMAHVKTEAANVTDQILDKFARMDDMIADLRHLGTDAGTLALLQKERSRITENFLALQSTIGASFHAKGLNIEQRTRIYDMLGAKADKLTNAAFGGADSAAQKPSIIPPAERPEAIEHAAALRLSQALTAPNQGRINSAISAIVELRRRAYQNDAQMSARRLFDLSLNIEQLSGAADAYLSGRREEAKFDEINNDLVNFHRHLSDRLKSGLSDFLRLRRDAIAATAKAADEALYYSGAALFILALMSVIMVVVVAVLLDHNISGRLRRLQFAMHDVAAGERHTKIPFEGNDEIGKMAKSLSVFVETLKRQEFALQTARNDAVAANRAKTQFLANMSHELRTPLNSILGFSEIIHSGAMGPPQPARYGEYANDIHESGRYLLDLINDILDLAKIEEGRTEIREGPVSVSGCIDDALRLITQDARDAHIAIETDLPPLMPLIRADSRMLVQICTNLLSNAVRFTPPGGSVTIATRIDDFGRFVLSVTDNGMGMSPTDIETALSAFEHFDSDVRRRSAGPGLRLPLTLQLVKPHDGAIEIESAPGQGTTVQVTFPAERVRGLQGPTLTVVENGALYQAAK
jgi:signal transduction histidine kinase